MGFNSYKNNQSKSELETELKVIENSITDEMPTGDVKVLEKRINKIKGQIELLDSTVSADIAMTTTNLMAPCTGKPDCECQKCKLLRRDDVALKVNESVSFGHFYGM